MYLAGRSDKSVILITVDPRRIHFGSCRIFSKEFSVSFCAHMHEITKYFQRSGRNSLLKIMHELNWMRRGSTAWSTVIKMTDLLDLSDLPATYSYM